MNVISILLVEDHEVFAKSLIRALGANRDIQVVAVAKSAEEALEQLPHLKFDLVLVDVSLPQMNGISLVEEMLKKYPHLRCAVLSGHLSPRFVQRALDAGARGYLVKDNPRGILEGIDHIMKGEVYVSKELDDALNETPPPAYGDNLGDNGIVP